LNEKLAIFAQQNAEAAAALKSRAWQIIDDAEMKAAENAMGRPGVQGFLERLDGLPIVLYTNNSLQCAKKALVRAGISENFFFDIYAREEPGSLKPSPDPIADAVASLGENAPGRVVMVGDHPYDMQALRAFEQAIHRGGIDGTTICAAIGVIKDHAAGTNLEKNGADFLVSSLDEAGDLILTEPIEYSLSLVILAYNEEMDISRAIEDARTFCRYYTRDYEIIVVDDGSSDGTALEIESKKAEDLQVVTHTENRGMGASMQHGYETATKDYVAHLPGDRQVRSQHLVHFLPSIKPNRVVLSTYSKLPSGIVRGIVSKVFRFLVKYGGGLSVDFAGTYVFERSRYLHAVPADNIASGTFLFSFQLLEEFKRLGVEFKEVTIAPFAREADQSREATIRRMGNMLREIAANRIHSLRLGADRRKSDRV
jgi:HAD superfamily hydrolase (TIGR01549 family)